jgi:hypothetical protein
MNNSQTLARARQNLNDAGKAWVSHYCIRDFVSLFRMLIEQECDVRYLFAFKKNITSSIDFNLIPSTNDGHPNSIN